MLLRTHNGATVDATDEHAALLLDAGWHRVEPTTQELHETDLSALTVAQLKSLCADRGIDVPRRATKAQIIALLTE